MEAPYRLMFSKHITKIVRELRERDENEVEEKT
jgi:hypothetical protein